MGSDDPQFDRLSDRIDLNNTLGCLDKREKMIIYLKFYAGHSQTEIAKRLGISQMHVSRLERRALMKMRQLIGTEAAWDRTAGPAPSSAA